MPHKNGPGCGPCCDAGPCAQVCVTAHDACSPFAAVAGAEVTLTQGVDVTGPCTTDGAGRCCNGSVSGAYSVTVTATGFLAATLTGTAVCPPPPTPVAYGPRYPGTLADDAAIGTGVWTNPGNAGAADSTFATAPSTASTPTHYLKGTNFGFTLPTDGTEAVTGIALAVFSKANAASVDHEARVVKGGSIVGTNLAVGASLSTGAGAALTYGGTAQLWGTTWTPAEINASTFGVAWSAKSPGLGSTPATAGPTYAGTGADDATSGGNAWTSPGNITANDGTSATATTATSVATHLVKGTNYGFAIPAGATITSIVLEVGVKASAGGVTTDSKAHLVVAGTPQTGTNLAAGTTLNTATITAMSYTFSSSLPTVAQINASGFGGAWSAVSGNFPALTVSCDWMRIAVNYTTLGDATISVDYARVTVYTSTTTYELAVALMPDTTHVGFVRVVTGAGCVPPGATWTLDPGGYTSTTDAHGQAPTIAVPVGAYTWTLSEAGFVDRTGSTTFPAGCSTTWLDETGARVDRPTVPIVLHADSAHFELGSAGGSPCNDAIPAPVTATGWAGAGPTSLTYAGFLSGAYTWTGCQAGATSSYFLTYKVTQRLGCTAPVPTFSAAFFPGNTTCTGSPSGTTTLGAGSGTPACPVAFVFANGASPVTVNE